MFADGNGFAGLGGFALGGADNSPAMNDQKAVYVHVDSKWVLDSDAQ